jgi:hypothetical protein
VACEKAFIGYRVDHGMLLKNIQVDTGAVSGLS